MVRKSGKYRDEYRVDTGIWHPPALERSGESRHESGKKNNIPCKLVWNQGNEIKQGNDSSMDLGAQKKGRKYSEKIKQAERNKINKNSKLQKYYTLVGIT